MQISDVVSNWKVYGLDDSVKASKYPMAVDLDALDSEITPTTLKLAQSKAGSGEDNFLNGVLVQFDLTFSVKAWVEMEPYHFMDFVSSQSTMHRIARMDIAKQCNEYVCDNVIQTVRDLCYVYNDNPTADKYLRLLYNVPVGFRLTARMTTNYRQLKTIYHQRKNHRLPEWRVFCKWIETLPQSEFITG